jgi:hypothetical protein
MSVLFLGTLYISYTNSKQIDTLKQENANLNAKIDSVLQITKEQLPQQPMATETLPSPKGIGSAILDYLMSLGDDADNDASVKKSKKKRIVVDTKYRIEDRYVRYDIEKPELKGDEVGNVVISILVNSLGDVNSAKLKSATGITNEEVIEACKKAALKTQFNYDSDTDYNEKKRGTITYIFSEK